MSRDRRPPTFAEPVSRGDPRARNGRREPRFDGDGDVRPDDVGGVPPLPHRHRPRPRSRRWPWLAAAAFAILAVLLALRQPLGDWLWPETHAQRLRAQADAALAQGRLTASDGSGARELYEAALAIDPDRSEARTGLANVARAALAQARAATAQRRFEDAHRHLQLARALSVPRAEADAVAEALRRQESAHAGLDRLLAQAEAARVAGRLDGAPDAALPLYRRVLALQPERADALRGREDALAELLAQARASLRAGDLAAAAAQIAAARSYDSGHVDLPDTQARLTEEVDAVRGRAETALRRGRLADAAEGYRRLLQLAADDPAAQAGLARVAAAHAARAERLAADFEFAAADAALREARALVPELAEIREAERHLARARQARAQLAPTLPAPERARRVRDLLAAAAAAEARGDLLAPPGDSAFDHLRAARALAPDDAAVRRASARLLPAAIDCFERELRGNNLARARACLDARSALADDDTALAAARRRLAQRWLAVGNERLGAGELAAAAAALAAARAIDADAPGLSEFAERVRTAQASGG